nr:nucleotidyl transferase AbiEii/AbiGii toxin family protein [Bacteroidota bacterium]
MALPQLANFALVGGTALALKYGHRVSIDLDLFSNVKFDNNGISEYLQNEFGDDFKFEKSFSRIGIFCFIKGIKTDIVYYPHPIIANLEEDEDIRMYSSDDIAAMKIQAILGRGKKKDFFDLAELLNHYSLREIVDFHKRKYPSQMILISVPQALIYFDEAEESEDPVSLKNQTWPEVKKFIRKKVNEYLM